MDTETYTIREKKSRVQVPFYTTFQWILSDSSMNR